MNPITYQRSKDEYQRLKKQIGGGKNTHSNLEPVAKNFAQQLDKSNDPPIYKLSDDDARNVLNDLQKDNRRLMESLTDVDMIEIEVPYEVPFTVTVITPKKNDTKIPIVLYVHGGGWRLGNLMTHFRLIEEIVRGSEVAVVFVNYTPSPEARFPVAINQSYEALKFIKTPEFAQRFNNLDTERIGVIGDSVGGQMSISLVSLTIKNNGPNVSYLIITYPVTDPGMNSNSYKQYENGPWLTKNAMQWFWDAYEPIVDKRNNDLMNSLLISDDILKQFPSTLIITDENDVLRDEGEMFAHKLMSANPEKEVLALRVLGTLHDFLMLNPLASSNPTQGTLEIINMKLRKHLHM